jgi:hypothetical protein
MLQQPAEGPDLLMRIQTSARVRIVFAGGFGWQSELPFAHGLLVTFPHRIESVRVYQTVEDHVAVRRPAPA